MQSFVEEAVQSCWAPSSDEYLLIVPENSFLSGERSSLAGILPCDRDKENKKQTCIAAKAAKAHMTNSSTVSVFNSFAAIPGEQKSQPVTFDRHSCDLTLVFPNTGSGLWVCGPGRAEPRGAWRAHDGVGGLCHGSHHSRVRVRGRFW